MPKHDNEKRKMKSYCVVEMLNQIDTIHLFLIKLSGAKGSKVEG